MAGPMIWNGLPLELRQKPLFSTVVLLARMSLSLNTMLSSVTCLRPTSSRVSANGLRNLNWSLTIHAVSKVVRQADQPALYHLVDGTARGLVRERLLLVHLGTKLFCSYTPIWCSRFRIAIRACRICFISNRLLIPTRGVDLLSELLLPLCSVLSLILKSVLRKIPGILGPAIM